MVEQATQSQDGVSKTTPSLQIEEVIKPLTDEQREKILKRRLKFNKHRETRRKAHQAQSADIDLTPCQLIRTMFGVR